MTDPLTNPTELLPRRDHVQPQRITMTFRGADIRGYYAELGIVIPEWASRNASVRCFANPGAHRAGDRHPSCSINLEHGAWCCHGCGAKGSVHAAALALGLSPRSAIDLMIQYGLTERRDTRTRRTPPSELSRRPLRRSQIAPKLAVTERDVRDWQAALPAQTDLIVRLARERSWLYDIILELEIGFDRGRLTIPVRNETRQLVGLLRYQPWPKTGEPKMLAATGSRRQLLPHPAIETSEQILLVEGEPDMIAARSRQIPAIAVPGAESWRAEWAPLLAGREITIAMDCDRDGRRAAARIAQDLCGYADAVEFNIAPERNDGYDITDLLRDHPRLGREVLR